MRILLALFLSFSCFVSAFGQDTLWQENFPKKGDAFPVKAMTLTKSEIPYLLFYTGISNFNYDLSYLNPTEEGFDIMDDPKNLQGGDQVKAADYGFAYDYGTAFFANEPEAISMVGLSPNLNTPIPLTFVFDSSVAFMQAPITYGQKVVDSTTSRLQIPFFYDINATMKSKYEVNGYGKLTLPGDTTFDVLRIRRVLTFTAIAKQLLNNQTDTLADSLITWEFYTKNYASTVLRVEISLVPVDTLIDTVAIFTFFDDRTVSNKSIAKPSNKSNSYFLGQKLISNSQNASIVYVYSLSGQLLAQSGTKAAQHQIDVSHLPKGNYLVLQFNQGKSQSQLLYKSE